MLPVSGAEQLKTSGAMRASAHDLAERGILEICQPRAVLAVRQKQIPEPRGASFGLELFHDFCRQPPIAPDLIEKALFVWINVLVHEGLQAALQILHFVAEFEFHLDLLSAGESGGALLDKMRDALFEILALQTRKHFALGDFERLRERLEHRVVELALDHSQRARDSRWTPCRARSPHLLQEDIVRENLVHQPHAQRFGRIDRPRRKKQIERVWEADKTRQHPRHSILGNQSAPGESRAEPGGIRGPPQIAVQRDDQAQADDRAVNRGDHRLSDRWKIGVLLLEVRPRAFPRCTGLHARSLVPSIKAPIGHAAEQ